MLTPMEEQDEVFSPDAQIFFIDSDEEVKDDQNSSAILRSILTQGASEAYSSTYVNTPTPSLKVSNEDECITCPICLDPWTNIGEHRLCALKCGHSFGFSCISRWILKRNKCPTCKKRATPNEIRYIYPRKLVAADATKIEELNCKVTEAVKEKNDIKLDLTKYMCRERLMANEIKDLKSQVGLLSAALKMKPKYNRDSIEMFKVKSLELCEANGCRVLSYYNNDNLIVASRRTPNSMFSKYGVQKVDVATFRPTSYIPLHWKPIRDVQFHKEKPWLLSVSFDTTLKIVDTNSNKVMVTSESSNNLPLWSCSWDTNDPTCFFVGEQGSVSKYDLRRMDRVTDTYIIPGNDSPVVSVATISGGFRGPFIDGGIIVCNHNSLQVFSNKPSEYCTRHILPIDPPFMYTTYDNTRHLMLVSTRPTSKVPHARYYVGKLVFDDLFNNLLSVNMSCCFQGSTTSKFLSRSCLFSHEEDGFAAAYQESLGMMYVWNTDTGKKVGEVSAENPILDLCSTNAGNSSYIFSLTDSAIDCFKLQ